ncbi:transcriptional regulator [Marinoscillum sp. MHG1-6]|uniref:transcriptional regulator n=1 Tax=Marinoscillum sp. MHG1-6 TaxID=2959627 RepID=UPI002158943C|nr:transcriptional regulator [Marinoscillum sp. MHG1-6]
MIAVITGDIINSRKEQNTKWLDALKAALDTYGIEPKTWEIYRGDSFQLELPIEKAVHAALYLKATIRQFKGLDSRIAIGIGEKSHDAVKITQSNGTAFHNSGDCFEELKKNTLAIKSPFKDFNEEMNCYLRLALLTIDRWSVNVSTIVKIAMENPDLTQVNLAQLINKSQSTTSNTLSRAGFYEMMSMEKRYRELIKQL